MGCALACDSAIGSDHSLEIVDAGIQGVELVLERQRAWETGQNVGAWLRSETDALGFHLSARWYAFSNRTDDFVSSDSID